MIVWGSWLLAAELSLVLGDAIMKKRVLGKLVAVLVALLGGGVGSGCGAMGALKGPPLPPDLSGSLPVSNRLWVGHVCAIGPKLALTADHVAVYHAPLNYVDSTVFPLLADIDQRPVTLMPIETDTRRDLALVRLDDERAEFPVWYTVAETVPRAGEKVYLAGYDYTRGLVEVGYWAEVLNVSAGHLYYNFAPGPGSSGGCVLNQAGELVAINTHVFQQWDGTSFKVSAGGPLVAGPYSWQDAPRAWIAP